MAAKRKSSENSKSEVAVPVSIGKKARIANTDSVKSNKNAEAKTKSTLQIDATVPVAKLTTRENKARSTKESAKASTVSASRTKYVPVKTRPAKEATVSEPTSTRNTNQEKDASLTLSKVECVGPNHSSTEVLTSRRKKGKGKADSDLVPVPTTKSAACIPDVASTQPSCSEKTTQESSENPQRTDTELNSEKGKAKKVHSKKVRASKRGANEDSEVRYDKKHVLKVQEGKKGSKSKKAPDGGNASNAGGDDSDSDSDAASVVSGNADDQGSVVSAILEEDICFQCGLSTISADGWGEVIMCDVCDGEYHCSCQNLTSAPEGSFVCLKCTGDEAHYKNYSFEIPNRFKVTQV
jgi:hypothetical protein